MPWILTNIPCPFGVILNALVFLDSMVILAVQVFVYLDSAVILAVHVLLD